MRIHLIRIGDTRVLPLPKSLLAQCGFGEEAEIKMRGRVLQISPVRKLREGWEEAFREMARRGDDDPLL